MGLDITLGYFIIGIICILLIDLDNIPVEKRVALKFVLLFGWPAVALGFVFYAFCIKINSAVIRKKRQISGYYLE